LAIGEVGGKKPPLFLSYFPEYLLFSVVVKYFLEILREFFSAWLYLQLIPDLLPGVPPDR
jgi:hypothetical protein